MHRKPTISHSSPLQIFQRTEAQCMGKKSTDRTTNCGRDFQAAFHPNLPPLFWRQEKTVLLKKSTQQLVLSNKNCQLYFHMIQYGVLFMRQHLVTFIITIVGSKFKILRIMHRIVLNEEDLVLYKSCRKH